MKVKAGESNTFDCSDLVVYPIPVLSWKKDGAEITGTYFIPVVGFKEKQKCLKALTVIFVS